MKTEVAPTPVDQDVSEQIAHRFCWCQWVDSPTVATSLCGTTLPINGERVKPGDSLCDTCMSLKGIIVCPICHITLGPF